MWDREGKHTDFSKCKTKQKNKQVSFVLAYYYYYFLSPCRLSKHILSWLDSSPGLPGDHFSPEHFHIGNLFPSPDASPRQLMFTCLINNWLQPFQFSPLIGSQSYVTYHFMSSILLDFYITPLMPSGKLRITWVTRCWWGKLWGKHNVVGARDVLWELSENLA